MRFMNKMLVVAVLLVILPGRADAVFVELFTSGDNETVNLSNALTATVNANPRTISLDLAVDVPQTATLNEVDFETILVSAATGSDTLAQTLTLNSPSGTPGSYPLSQSANIVMTHTFPSPPTANVTVGAMSPLLFDLGPQYDLTVTPLGGSLLNNTSGEATFNNEATFLLTEIPEPSSVTCAVLAGAAMLVRRRTQRA